MDEEMTLYHPGFLIIEDEKILSLGPDSHLEEELKERFGDSLGEGLKWVDADDGIVIPGMINAHTHLGMIPFRSLGDDMPDRLRRFLFPLEQVMTEKLVRASARYAMAEMLLAGITTFADMYYFEGAIAEEVASFGMRALLGQTVIQHPTCDSDGKTEFSGLSLGQRMIQAWKGKSDLITPMIAPHAPNTNTDQSLLEVKRIAREYQTPVMIHLNEFDYEVAYYKTERNTTPVGYLDQLGLLNNQLIGVHLIHTNDDDIQRLADSGARVVHCIGANLKSAKGVMPLKAMLQAKIPVALGTDGPSSGNTLDLFSIMRTVAITHKTREKDRAFLPSDQVLKLATQAGAKVLGIEKIGMLKQGYWADITLIETQSVNMFPNHDPYASLVYAANPSNVKDVWVKGRQLVKNKELVEWDLMELRQDVIAHMDLFNQRARELSE